jgi:hypothetical protein
VVGGPSGFSVGFGRFIIDSTKVKSGRISGGRRPESTSLICLSWATAIIASSGGTGTIFGSLINSQSTFKSEKLKTKIYNSDRKLYQYIFVMTRKRKKAKENKKFTYNKIV